MPGTKKVFIKTFGCQMNVYDSERMIEALSTCGYAQTNDISEADVVVLNTCHIREKAAEKVYSDLGRFRQTKENRRKEGKQTLIAVAGCVAQAEGQEIINRAPAVDLVVGPQSYHKLPELLFRARTESRRLVETTFPIEDKFSELPHRNGKITKTLGTRSATAFLTIQEGCDKFCTFCVVPYTRGMEYSRSVESLVKEAESLVASGVREVTLLGQNVNAYHGQGPNKRDWSLAMLIARLAEIDGLERLRYTTSHPNDMTDDLIYAHRDQPKLMPYLHLPFQAGSDRILAAMNRKHTVVEYRKIIDQIRNARPDIALSTDIIVGFPGESDADFQGTLDLIEDIKFAQAFSFKYSARPGTPAATIDEQIPDEVKAERLQKVQELLNTQQNQFNANCIGRTFPVLLEQSGRYSGQLVGRSPYLQPVHVEGPIDLLGRIMDVEISAAWPNSLAGVITTA